MKHKNLQILKKRKLNVPLFYAIESINTKDQSLLVQQGSGTAILYTFEQFLSLLNKDLYAVRSSCACEDNSSQSYAGQFTTLLNVKPEDVVSSIEQVFNSYSQTTCYNSPILQKSEVNCVIVQEMIQADISGVIFTANPNGLLNETVITVGYGSGDGVVEDKVETTTYYFNTDDQKFYAEYSKRKIELNSDTLLELIHIAKRIEKIFSEKCDIEFCIQDNVIYILQARPITTLKISNAIVLDNSNIVESYPGVSLPLTQDFVKELYHDIFVNCLSRVTESDELVKCNDHILQNMVDVANWGMYYRINNWYSVLKLLPCSSFVIPIWQKMLGVKNKTIDINRDFKTDFKTKCKMLFLFFKYLHLSPTLTKSLNDGFENMLTDLTVAIDNCTTVNELIAVYQTVKQIALSNWDITLINDMYAFIYTGLAGKRNANKIANISNLASMQPILSLEKLVEIKKLYGQDSDVYKTAFNKHVELYGDRCIGELKLETKTYRTNPELLEQYIDSYQSSVRVKPHVPMDSLGPIVKRARLGIENREISRLNRSRLFGLGRTLFRKIGKVLVQEKRLRSEDDVFYLHLHELTQPGSFKRLVQERKRQEKFYVSLPRFERLVFANKVFDKTCMVQCVCNNINSYILHGTPTSFGTVTAEVIVIDDASQNVDTTNKIIVTKTTDPGWVYLIKNAVGVIAEKGSLLSHTAIISRELHKPAIVNVEHCTTILKTGDIVTIDAEKGIVIRS